MNGQDCIPGIRDKPLLNLTRLDLGTEYTYPDWFHQIELQVQDRVDHCLSHNTAVGSLSLFDHTQHDGTIDRWFQQEPFESQWFFHRTRDPDRVYDHKAMSRSGVEGAFKHNFRLAAVETAEDDCNLG